MNRPLLLTAALVLMATAASMARAQSFKHSQVIPARAPLDCLKAVRAHVALLRAQPLALPPAVVRTPQAVPPRPWGQSPAFSAVAGAPSQGASSGCFR